MTRLYIAALVFAGFASVETGFQKPDVRDEHSGYVRTPEKLSATNDSFILWSSSRKLTWDDFQGNSDEKSEYKAMTYCKMSLNDSISSTAIFLNITCKFNKNNSWTKIKNSDYLLKHEQLHFDIAELIIRKVRKECSLLVSSDKDGTYAEIKKIYSKYVDIEWDSLNASYDTETSHGTIATKQKDWELKIAKELKALNAYSSTRVVIKRVKK